MSDNAKNNNCDDTKPSCDTTNAGPETSKDTPPPQVNLLEVPINTEHDALNVIVGFLGMAQRRGCFAINESAKIYECVKMFQSTEPSKQ